MNIISTKMHAVLDYLVGIWLIVMPSVLGFSSYSIQASLPVLLGVATIIYSLLTDYELSIVKLTPMPVHLLIDLLSALLLATSPWLFGFHNSIYMPHLFTAILEVVVIFFSKKTVRYISHPVT